LEHLWLLAAICALGGLVQGVTGFGFALFTMGVLVAWLPFAEATIVVSVGSLASALYNLWSVRGAIDWREVRPTLVPVAPGVVLGLYLMRTLDLSILRVGVAVAIVGGCLVTLWSPGKARLHSARPWAYVAGAVASVFGGALGLSGPPIVLYVLLRGWEKEQAKGALTAFFAVTNTLRLALLIAQGAAPWGVWRTALLLIAPVFAGVALGSWLFRQLSTRIFRYLAIALLGALAIRALVT
jgi:uncharacterized membrane protein YfcA